MKSESHYTGWHVDGTAMLETIDQVKKEAVEDSELSREDTEAEHIDLHDDMVVIKKELEEEKIRWMEQNYTSMIFV